MIRNKNKAQAALEFLTTYAWAFIVILMMIGALAYFGILSPSSLLPNKCTISSEFQCLDWFISSSASSIRVKIKNNVGEAIVANMTATSDGSVPLACTTSGFTMSTGQQADFNVTCSNFQAAGMISGEKRKVLFTLRYHTIASGASYPHEANGELFSVVE
jgi:hypothetical protein